MNYKDFIEEYNKNPEILKEHVFTKKYVTLAEKLTRAQNIINAAYYLDVTDSEGNVTGRRFHIDSVVRDMLMDISMVDMYTDLEREEEDRVLAEYDQLMMAGILRKIKEEMSSEERAEYERIVMLVGRDTMTNEYEPHAYFREQIDRFGNLIGTALLPIISQIDVDKVVEKVKEGLSNGGE